MLEKLSLWMALRAAQPEAKAADECSHCSGPAVHHVTWRFYGHGPRGVTVLYTQTCDKHKPLAQVTNEDLHEALVEPTAVPPGW